MKYKKMVQITPRKEPIISKHGNPTQRFTLDWGFVAFDDDGNRVETADLVESSDGNLLVLAADNRFVWSRARGIYGYALNRPSQALYDAVMETLTNQGICDILVQFAKKNKRAIKSVLDEIIERKKHKQNGK